METVDLSKERLIEDLISLVNIPSVYSENAETLAPFGIEIKRALETTLEIGNRFGFKTKNYEGYAGEISIGSGEYMVGILGHVDVVPAGEGWETDPFDAVIKDGKIYGRGSLDDKGPIVACLYAMKELSDANKIPSNVTLRMIIGTNEEEAWDGINYYLKKVDRLPDIAIVPDAMFPPVFCEKGLYDVNLHHSHNATEKEDIKLIKLEAGAGRNVVCPKAECTLLIGSSISASDIESEIIEFIEKNQIDGAVELIGNEISLTVIGKGAHAMSPEKGVNALSQLMKILYLLKNRGFSHEHFTNSYVTYIGDDYSGKKGFFNCSDIESGDLTFNVGTASLQENGSIIMQANVRYPASLSFEKIESEIKEGLGKGEICTEFVDHLKPIYLERDSKVIEQLMAAYQEVTGDYESEPTSMGGATYARAIPNAVAFGGTFPYEEELAHEANEFIAIDSLEKSRKIYIKALTKLMEKE